jgi:hypothetical protein
MPRKIRTKKGSPEQYARIRDRASVACACLEEAWQLLRKVHPQIPKAVMVVLPASAYRAGHFSASSWQYKDDERAHEVGVSPILFDEPKDVIVALLHEAVHAILFPEYRGGCSTGANKYYHRATFRDACPYFGLECRFKNTRYGWAITQWPDGEVPVRYAGLLKYLDANLPLGVKGPELVRLKGKPLPNKGHIRLTCQCDPPRSIYAGSRVSERGGILCQICMKEFTLQTAPDEAE